MIGVIPTREALKIAMDQGLDLVEVSPNANPPVCRIMDYGKFRYDESIRQREARKKAHRHTLKEIKFHATVADHDYAYKVRHIREFLQKGHKVRVSLQFRGRENVHREFGFAVIDRVLKDCQDVSLTEMAPKLIGNTIVALLAPTQGKRHGATRPPPSPPEVDRGQPVWPTGTHASPSPDSSQTPASDLSPRDPSEKSPVSTG